MSPNESRETDFSEAVGEAFDSLREAYPDRDFLTGQPTVGELTTILIRADQTDLRRDVAQVVSLLAERFPAELVQVAPDLYALIDADDQTVRKHVLLALGYASKAQPERVQPVVDRLAGLLDGDDVETVSSVAWIISNIAAADAQAIEPAVPEIVHLIDSDDEQVQRHAARTIGSIAGTYPDVVEPTLPRLLDLLQSTPLYRAVGNAIVEAAPVFGERLVPELFDRLAPGQPALREHAAWTFVPLAENHPELVWPRWPDLIEIVRTDEDQQVQNSIAAALAALACYRPEADLLETLIDLLDHDDPFVRRYGCLALGDIAMETADSRVLEALADARAERYAFISDQAEDVLVEVAREYPEAVGAVSPDLVESMEES